MSEYENSENMKHMYETMWNSTNERENNTKEYEKHKYAWKWTNMNRYEHIWMDMSESDTHTSM